MDNGRAVIIQQQQLNTRQWGTPSWAVSNPDNYWEAFRFYSGEHSQDMQRYIMSAFPRNGDKLRKKMTRITQRFVQSGANLYKYGLKRKFAGARSIEYETTIRLNNEMMLAERFQFYMGISALWIAKTGTGNSEIDYEFTALSAAQFSYKMGKDGGVEAFYMRKGSRLDENGIEWWEWFMFFNGTISIQISDKFNRLSDEIGVDLSAQYAAGTIDYTLIKQTGWHPIGSYTVLPFLLLFSDKYKYTPNSNNDIAFLEKDHVADLTLVRAAMLVAIIKMLVAPGADEQDVARIYEVFGALDGIIAGPPGQSQPTALDMGDTKNHLDFFKFTKDELVSICIQYGVDYTVIVGDDDKIVSGRLRELKTLYMHDVHAEREVGYCPIEFKLFRLLNSISSIFPLLEWVKFNPIPPFMSKDEAEAARKTEIESDILLIANKLVLQEEMIEKYNPDKTPEEMEKIKAILTAGDMNNGNDVADDIDVDSIVGL